MMLDLLPHVPTLALILLVFYLVVSQRRERRRAAEIPADLVSNVEGLLRRVDELGRRVDELNEQSLAMERRLLDTQELTGEVHERLAKHRTAFERFGSFLEDELNRIDQALIDLNARANAWSLPGTADLPDPKEATADADYDIEDAMA